MIIPLVAVLFLVDLTHMGGGLALLALLATPALAAAGTLFGSMTARRGRASSCCRWCSSLCWRRC